MEAPEVLCPLLLICPASCTWARLELPKNRRKHGENRAVFEGEMAHKSHTIESMVRGYHVYGEIWLAAVGEELSCMSEVKNSRNLFAVAVMKSGVVGHVPRKISSVCSMFLR